MVTYTNNINVGTATASATYAGDANHSGSSDTETFAIDPGGVDDGGDLPGGRVPTTGSAH